MGAGNPDGDIIAGGAFIGGAEAAAAVAVTAAKEGAAALRAEAADKRDEQYASLVAWASS